MPSSGWGIENVTPGEYRRFEQRLRQAKESGMEVEWLGSLVSALHQGADIDSATWAGIEEWDL